MNVKRIAILGILVALFSASCTQIVIPYPVPISQGRDRTVGVKFETPEDAITHYLDGVAQNDVDRILEACAIEEVAERYEFGLFAERMRAIDPMNAMAPSDYPFYAEMNKDRNTWNILAKVRLLSYSLLSSEDMSGRLIVGVDTERIRRFIREVDPGRLSDIRIKKIRLPPNGTFMNEPRYQERATLFGADEITERLVLFSFDQADYYIGFTLLRYGDDWKIFDASSPMASTSSLGTAERITEEEFERMINVSD